MLTLAGCRVGCPSRRFDGGSRMMTPVNPSALASRLSVSYGDPVGLGAGYVLCRAQPVTAAMFGRTSTVAGHAVFLPRERHTEEFGPSAKGGRVDMILKPKPDISIPLSGPGLRSRVPRASSGRLQEQHAFGTRAVTCIPRPVFVHRGGSRFTTSRLSIGCQCVIF